MKITIINSERNEKRYTREELEEFVAQLRDGTYRQQYVRDFNKEVCFAAEWVKLNGELKAKSYNSLILLSLENLRDLSTVEEYKRLATLQPYTLLCFMGHDGHSLHIVCPYTIRRKQHCSMPSANCITSIRRSWVRLWLSTSQPSKPVARRATIRSHSIIHRQ